MPTFLRSWQQPGYVFRPATMLSIMLLLSLSIATAESGSTGQFVVERDGRTIVVEPYGPNFVRITMSSEKSAAVSKPGYGFIGSASAEGWSRGADPDGYETMRSPRLVVRLAPASLPPRPMPLDQLNQSLRDVYFGGATSRKVYLPGGCDWYNYWTNERI